jgi:hypothetical protein
MWEHRPLYIIFTPPVGKRKKTLHDGNIPGFTDTLSGSSSGGADLKKGIVVADGE